MTAAQPPAVPADPPPAVPADPPAHAPRPARTSRGRALTAVGIVAAVGLLAMGVVQLLAWVLVQTTSATATMAPTDVVELVADGEVRVTVADVDEVRVERTASFTWTEPRYDVTSDADRTVVRHTCEWLLAGRCSAGLAVAVPEGTQVVVRTSDGAVRVAGPAGDVEVRAADGAVQVTGARGAVDVRGADGHVDLADIRGDVVVHLADGNLRITDAGGDVDARGRDGAVVVAGADGDVDVRATDGRLEVRDVRGEVTARSGDGDVLVAAVDGDLSVHAGDGNVRVHGSGEPVALTVVSGGRQRIEGPTDPGADVHVELRTGDGEVAYLGPEA